VAKVNKLERRVKQLSHEELGQFSRELRRRAGDGVSLNKLLPEAYALVREAAVRTIQQRHYDVQILGGVALHFSCIAEMETGEGKTLVATLPAYLNALTGRGVHVVTVNDYLAARDAEWNGPIYRMLGLTVGCVLNRHSDEERRRAYRCDITYATSKELGFDFLRDRLKLASAPESNWGSMVGVNNGRPQLVQRAHHYSIVDEADSILIDEARTPMIISAAASKPGEEAVERYRWYNVVAQQLQDEEHYKFDSVKRKVELTQEGCRQLRGFEQSPAVLKQSMEDIYKGVERAVLSHRGYLRDRDYVVKEGKVIIVDEFTGRLMPGREWQDGIHRAVEAKEQLKITVETGESARVTVQSYFKKYEKLAGMTGTAASEAGEFRKIYKTPVLHIPTNRPLRRKSLPDVVFATAEQKWVAIADEVARLHKTGRPVLIGTRSIEKSEHLSKLLTARGVRHQVLNAKEHEKEAAIVAQAGQPEMVTVATNMAGRGTDIKLGERVAELGGLHVIGTEKHTARRIDRQLAGRCARQGDPGSTQFYLSLEDEIVELIAKGEKLEEKLQEAVATRRLERLRAWAGRVSHSALQTRSMRKYFVSTQKRLENQHYRQRRQLMEYEKIWDKIKKEMGLDPVLDWKQL
jgi:preprotein translocase subunit SecA